MIQDFEEQLEKVAENRQIAALKILPSGQRIDFITAWRDRCASLMLRVFLTSLEAYTGSPDPTPYIGRGSKVTYSYVREQLGIPFLRAKMLIDAENKALSITSGSAENDGALGSLITKIYDVIRSGAMFEPAMGLLAEASMRAFSRTDPRPTKLCDGD